MNIEHLREFVYLAETLNFSITAKHFYISQSVLSKHIAALEDDLGTALLNRDRRHVELTANGRMFYEDCLSILNQYDHARARLATAGADRPVTITVGYLRNAAQPFIVEFMDYMEREHPQVQLVMTCMEYGELIRAHRSHQVEVIFSLDLDPEAEGLCDYGYVYTDRMYAVVGKKHPWAEREGGVACAELVDQTILYPRRDAYPGLNDFLDTFVPRSCRTPESPLYGDIDTMYLKLAKGNCAAFSSGHNFAAKREEVTFLPILDVDTSYTVSARWLKTMEERKVQAIAPGIEHARRTMIKWSDGVGS